MVKFNWKTLRRVCNNDPTKMYSLFKYYYKPDTMMLYGKRHLHLRRYFSAGSEASSFINEHRRLVENELNAGIYEIYWYIYLAGLRNIGDFVFKKQLWLDIELIPERFKDERMRANKLLTFDDSNDKLIFNYEETK